jgi:hypothetical protein
MPKICNNANPKQVNYTPVEHSVPSVSSECDDCFNSQIKINKIFIKFICVVYLFMLRLKVCTETKIR